jgi:hypothetical protein
MNATDGDDIQFGVTGTINLTRALPDLTHSINIEGPGPDQLTVRRNTGLAYPIFTVGRGPTVLSGLTVANGFSALDLDGGGIVNGGTLTLNNTIVSGNSAPIGGGIFNVNGTVTVSRSTLSGNSALYNGLGPSGFGGGIFNYAEGGFATVTVTNSTLSGNDALDSGGIANDDPNCTVTVTNSTLSGNSATLDSGGIGNGGLVHSRNTIIAGNTAPTGSDLIGNLASQGYNLIGGGSGFSDTDLVGTHDDPIDPLLGPLQDNGGLTQTMALLPSSPALNVGDPGQLGVPDQRGVVRTGGVNIGAFQASATAFVLSAPVTVQSGVPFDVTVTAVDPFCQVAVGYTGTVTFSTTDPDPGVVLPADYTFALDDGGSHTFTDTGLGETTLITPGDQTLTVMDTADNTITGSTTVTVDSMVPGAGSHGLVQALHPGRLPGSVPQASEPPQRQVVDWWFASVNKRDVGFILAQPIHHTHAEADWWALDPWRADEPMFA